MSQNRFVKVVLTTTLSGLFFMGVPSLTQAQNPILADGILYYTEAATITTDVSDFKVAIGRSPAGDPGADGDINLGTTPATAYTVTIADGARVVGASFPFDGYEALSVFNRNTVNIEGGLTNIAYGRDNSQIIVNGGTVNGVFARDNSTVTFNAVNAIQRTVANSSDNGRLNVIAGLFNTIGVRGDSLTKISGGNFESLLVQNNSVANLSGGSFTNSPTSTFRLFDNSTANLFGSLTIVETGSGMDRSGMFTEYRVSGTLQNGQTINKTVQVAPNARLNVRGGGTQSEAVQATIGDGGTASFDVVASGVWVNAPEVVTDSLEFVTSDGTTFTSILQLPGGTGDADDLFTVNVDGRTLGQFSSGSSVDFAAFGFGGGVSRFTISGISDIGSSPFSAFRNAANIDSFPVRLAFSSPFASFTVRNSVSVAAPEPATASLLLLVGSGFVAGCLRRSTNSRTKIADKK